jgi:hypothetical protein
MSMPIPSSETSDPNVTPPLRVLVVDDEQLARDELCYQLGQIADVEVVAQALRWRVGCSIVSLQDWRWSL